MQQTVKHVVWWSQRCFAALGPGTPNHNWCNHEFCSLPENVEEEYPSIDLWPEVQAQVDYSAGQWSEAYKQVHLCMSENK